MISVAWCTTCYEAVDVFSAASFLHESLAMGRLGWDVEPFVGHNMECAEACNAIMEDVERREQERGERFTHVLWMDDDIIVRPEDLERWPALLDEEHRVVFGLGFFRTHPYRPGIWKFAQDPSILAGQRMKYFCDYPEDAMVQVCCAGLCAALIDRTVFDLIDKPYFRWIEGGYKKPACTPDAYLCGVLMEANVDLWCHTGIKLKHVGMPRLVDEEYAIKFRDQWPEGVG